MVKPREEKNYKKVNICVAKLVQKTKLQKAIKNRTLQVTYYYILCDSKAY